MQINMYLEAQIIISPARPCVLLQTGKTLVGAEVLS
jgi:hypothetical protein